MPEPVKRGQRYMPGLDGLRAIAVSAVILYHLGFGWAQGGLLGVGVFFTLSGYLITDILLAQVDRGGIKLGSFWLARARRLLPALFVMLTVVTAWVTVIGPHQPGDFREAALSAAGYVNNWWLIFHHVSYFARFEAPSPLNHLWSLSVEEQFYIIWPFLLMAGIWLVSEVKATAGIRPRLALCTLGMALASTVLMAVLYHPSLDPSRVYYGTDTRALELLFGAALAMVWPSRRLQGRIKPQARTIIDAAGVVGLLVIFLMFWRTGEFSPFLYRGGFVLLSLATVLAVAAMAHPASRLGPIVGSQPLRWIGERSYGIYLWHFPVIVLTTPHGIVRGPSLFRDVLQVAAILGIAELSWRYVEDPIRHGALSRLWRQWRQGRWRREKVPQAAWAVLGVSGLVVAIAIAGLAGVGVSNPSHATGKTVAKTVKSTRQQRIDEHSTACKAVVHIGDSTSDGLVSTEYVRPSQLISAQYARVGVRESHLEVSGARSIYERFEGIPNAQEVAQAWKEQGFKGCWVVAMGTNEAANVAAGSTFGYDQRIESMMSTIGGEPVMWVNVKSLLTSTPYAEAGMRDWDKALREACDGYPNMRIYNWANDVKNRWFIEDGIHFTSEGYAERGRLIADALREAFPATEPKIKETDSRDCVVDPGAKAQAG
jgi:peptidoglycan/LPS O-acetylase OafA/YrhL